MFSLYDFTVLPNDQAIPKYRVGTTAMMAPRDAMPAWTSIKDKVLYPLVNVYMVNWKITML